MADSVNMSVVDGSSHLLALELVRHLTSSRGGNSDSNSSSNGDAPSLTGGGAFTAINSSVDLSKSPPSPVGCTVPILIDSLRPLSGPSTPLVNAMASLGHAGVASPMAFNLPPTSELGCAESSGADGGATYRLSTHAVPPRSPATARTRSTEPSTKWARVAVTSNDAFQRVHLNGSSATLAPDTEPTKCFSAVWAALKLRKKNFVSRKPTYYMGACDPADSPSMPAPPQEPVLNDLGVPEILMSAHRNEFHVPHQCRASKSVGLPSSGGAEASPFPRGSSSFDSLNRSESHPSSLAGAGGSSELRSFYRGMRPEPKFVPFRASAVKPVAGARVDIVNGVARYSAGGVEHPSPARTWREFVQDYEDLCFIVHRADVSAMAFRRLEMLEMRFKMHRILNADREHTETKAVPHRDFYNTRKIDTHVHHSACMNEKHLLRFIKTKLQTEPDTLCIKRDGKVLSLADVFKSLKITAYELSIDTLDMHADWSVKHRFDVFNLKYSPIGEARLREIFLKTSNMIGGRFLAELTQEVFADLAVNKYCLAEYRLSVYGKDRSEWGLLAKWILQNNLASKEVRWMIQLPRIYDMYMDSGAIKNFGDIIHNFFEPLFAVTLDPSVDPDLDKFLTIVSGIDLVDDESRPETVQGSLAELPPPEEWTLPTGPPYVYWCWYVSTNLAVLNSLRAERGLTQLSFRPHCGEAGDPNHLAAAFLTAEGINHGIQLRKVPTLEYLYYISQIGIAMSPLSNNKLFLDYGKNPFPEFFKRGLNVSLSTDDPLMLHRTKDPLVEEYAVAAQMYQLSSSDLAELSRNSVLQSGFEYPFKAHFIGTEYAIPGPEGNEITLTNLPNIRLQYRIEVLSEELKMLAAGKAVQDTVPNFNPVTGKSEGKR